MNKEDSLISRKSNQNHSNQMNSIENDMENEGEQNDEDEEEITFQSKRYIGYKSRDDPLTLHGLVNDNYEKEKEDQEDDEELNDQDEGKKKVKRKSSLF